MKFSHHCLALVIAMGLSGNIFSQEPKINKKSITIIEHKAAEEKTVSSSATFMNKAVKINPLLMLRGDLPVSVEFAPWDWLALEAGVGVTFGDIFYSHKAVDNAAVRNLLGYSLIANFKIFPVSDAFDQGTYYSFQYSKREYNQEYTIPSYPKVLPFKRVVESYTVIYGFQYFINDRWFVDAYGGVGIQKEKGITIRAYVDENGAKEYRNIEYKISRSGPFGGISGFGYALGLKLGYLF